ncbi:LacI family DNA-binding transcriptional regulator [candidate division KSB1 bacterium]|nr:LacI family DNA-binding transcriptional regulator [candidate division KSB1 bacterium]
MTATIKDVAKKAGVSLSTVSLVLNNKTNLSPETINKVKQAISDLNYHPRHSARGLASKKSGNIGFILTDDHFSRAEPFYTKIFLGSEFEARNYNYYILLTTIEQNFCKKSIPRFLLEKNVDGVILAGHIPDGLINFLSNNYNIPVVYIDYLPPKGKSFAILIDNVDGAKLAVEHLLEKGHRDIAFVCGEISHPSMQSRFLGYKQALKNADIPLREELVVTDELATSDESGHNATCKLLKTGIHFSAIFAGNDAMAIGCMKCLKKKQISVPDQIAIVGFDDVDIANQIDPKLTTMRVDKEEMGAIAIKNLVEMITKEKRNFGKVLVPVELVTRNST